MKNKILWLLLITACTFNTGYGQNALTDTTINHPDLKFRYSSLIIPTALTTYGFAGLRSARIKSYNLEIEEEVTEHIDKRFTIDDFSQYLPMVSVYGLNAFGIKGKNRFKKRTIVLATSYLLMSTAVLQIKSVTHVLRPDGSSYNSFPSGHTATVFMGAEFLWQEYKDVSVWYGITGYIVATGTGLFRIYNNRHWLTDVATGAGIGILSTKIAYWVSPLVMDKLFKDHHKQLIHTDINPFYNGRQTGLALSFNF